MTMVKKCVCIKDREIGEIHQDVKLLKKALLGNGQQGLFAEFNQAKGAIKLFKFLAIAGFVMAFVSVAKDILLN